MQNKKKRGSISSVFTFGICKSQLHEDSLLMMRIYAIERFSSFAKIQTGDEVLMKRVLKSRVERARTIWAVAWVAV